MKIRWTSDSLRFRITPTELNALLQGESVVETLALGGATAWQAVLRPSKEATRPVLDAASVTLLLAPPDCQRLAAPDAEGVYFAIEGETRFRYYIEKDFPCIHPRASKALETPTETFSAPPDFEARKA